MKNTYSKLYKYAIFSLFLLLLPNLALAKIPNDPNAEQWSFKDVRAYVAWEKATGSRDVVVAVIDNGFDTFHPDIYPNAWQNEDEIADNNIDDDKNGYVDDVWGWNFSSFDADHNGIYSDEELLGNNNPRPWVVGRQKIETDIHHGTLVAGIIGAVGDNNLAGAGINWHVRLMNLKVLEVNGVGNLSPLVHAIFYAVDNGADVINISLVGDVDKDVKDAIKYAYDRGVVVVAASGNDRVALNASPVYPVCADAGEKEQWVLGVTAIGEDHYLAQFSNTGASCIDITAPGIFVSSTMRYAPGYGLADLYKGGWSGTSFAAPFVSGAAALIKSIQPTWGPKQIYDAILKTVHRTPPTDPAAYQEIYGAGLLQINRAVDYAFEHSPSTHPLKSLLAIDLASGQYQENNIETNVSEQKTQNAFKNVDDIARYGSGFATVKYLGQNKAEVNIYSDLWSKIGTWQTDAKGKLQIIVGDVMGDSNREIILAPSYKDKQVLRVFDVAGKELKKLDIAVAHAGVSLGLVDNLTKKEILAVYLDNNEVKFHRFDKDLNVVKIFPLSFIKKTGQVSAGDIDGDGLQEYIVGGGVGDIPFIAYYANDGSLKRKFYGYSTSFLGGLNIAVGDWDRDGKDDVLVAPKSKTGSMWVWNYKSKKIIEGSFTLYDSTKFLPVYGQN